MTSALHVRPDLDLTLRKLESDLSESNDSTEVNDVPLQNIRFQLTGNSSSFLIGDREVPATKSGIAAFGDFLNIPAPFLKRAAENDLDLTEYMLNRMLLQAQAPAASVRLGDGGVSGVFEAGKTPLDPKRLVSIAMNVLGTDGAPVQRLVQGNDFSFDAHVPFDSERGVGGDASSLVDMPEELANYSWTSHLPVRDDAKVGDLTAGGLRFGVDLKRGLTPWVQPFMFRLACTNGMETTDDGLKVDGRGMTIDEVLNDLEAQAQRAFGRVEAQIAAFYALRDEQAPNPERALLQMARERDIPQRSARQLVDVAASDALPDEPSQFDIVNLVTNLANSPTMRNDGGRLLLERAGGAAVVAHEARCSHCMQRVGH